MDNSEYNSAEQLGFGDLLASADKTNRDRVFDRETAHLPGTMDEALPFYRALIARHHAELMAANVEEVMRLRGEAYNLACKLNGGRRGIIAGDDAPGCVLERETAAVKATEPLWGQQGEFIVTLDRMAVRIKLNGIFGIGSSASFWPGFSARAVEFDKPFLSSTGYRSFLGIFAEERPGMTPMAFVHAVITDYMAIQLKGKPVAIEKQYREWGRAE